MNIIERRKRIQDSKIRRWWIKNRYIFYRVFLFPIETVCLIRNKISDTQKFNKSRTKRYLDKALPRIVALVCSDTDRFMIAKDDEQCIGDVYLRDLWNFKGRHNAYFLRYREDVYKYIKTEYTIKGYSKYVAHNKHSWESIFGCHDFAEPYKYPYEVVLFIKNWEG